MSVAPLPRPGEKRERSTSRVHVADVALNPPRVLRCPCGCGRLVSATHAVLTLVAHDAPASPEG